MKVHTVPTDNRFLIVCVSVFLSVTGYFRNSRTDFDKTFTGRSTHHNKRYLKNNNCDTVTKIQPVKSQTGGQKSGQTPQA